MKRMTAAGLLVAAMLLLMTGCKEDTAASLYDPNYKSAPQPVVSAITSSHGTVTFAGISILTISGQNFSAVPSENLVYFDQTKAVVLEASPTQLKVKAPILVKDSIQMKIAVQNAAKYSDVKLVRIDAAVKEYGGLGVTEEAVGMATDAAGNLYASMKIAGAGNGIRKYDATTDAGTQYAPSGGVTQWTGLKVGPGGVLYGARVQRALYTIPAQGVPVLWAQAAGSSLTDLDFGPGAEYIYAVGNNANIYRFKVSDKSVATYPFTALLRSVRVFNGYVYVAGKQDSTEGVWRFKLNADGSLGAAELFFNLSAQPGYMYNGPTANAITFNKKGEMYLGTSGADAILLVAPDGKSAQSYYPGLFTPSTISFAWGKGSTLYAARGGDAAVKTIIKINTLEEGAPYYGAQ
ncbi:MAG: IPT/TIG domain-containing protein [Acidobacteriota bacterium]